MAIPPFNDLRLKKGEWPNQRRLEELLEGYARNFEDLYQRYQTTQGMQETLGREITGVVLGGGEILRGSGFTVSHPGTGEYILRFRQKFAIPVTCVATGVVGITNVVTASETEALITVKSIATAALANGAFHFIVKGR